jgi:hypothetical protein
VKLTVRSFPGRVGRNRVKPHNKVEFDRLVSFLPDDLKGFVRFGYYSGWRKGEISRIEWRDVQDTVRLRPEVSKNKDGRVLALIGEVAEIIGRRALPRSLSAPTCCTVRANPSKISARRGVTPAVRLGFLLACTMEESFMTSGGGCAVPRPI